MSDVENLRGAIEKLPDTAGVIIETAYGERFHLVKVMAIGTSTDDPGLVLRIALEGFVEA